MITTGKNFGHYEIREKLGAGGMGEVFLAEDTRLHRRVALKVLPENIASDKDRLRRFEREAHSASALNHPNILTIFEFGADGDTHFLAAEFVKGETLREQIQRDRPTLSETLDIAIQIASALQAAHKAGIIHRDIKPENVMIREDGYVKVLDFGLAKLSGPPAPASGFNSDAEAETRMQTEAGMILGTAAYMSPEQARGQSVDARTDIFSLGVVLYELLVGRQPFTGETVNHTIVAILEKEPLPLLQSGKDFPAEIERITFKTLAKDKNERYESAKDLLTDLKGLQKRLEFEAELGRASPPNKNAEAPTAILSHAAANAKETLAIVAKTDDKTSQGKPKTKRSRWLFALPLGLCLLAAGFFGYRYVTSKKQIESIAVLPFVNEGGNADIEYLSDGMTETLISSLSQLPKLNVKSRSSVFRYKGRNTDAQTIAKELNVQAILKGNVVERGQDLILNVELIDAQTENVLWTENYHRPMANLVSLQSEIARDVSSKLKIKLTSADERKLAKNYTTNTEAYQLYLKGRYYVFKLTAPETKKGIAYFQQAIALDPNYALAYVGLADANRALVLSADMPATEFLPKAKAAAQKAIEIDDTLAEAHTALGFAIFWYDWNWSAAENQYRRALELNPNYADTHWAYAHLLSNTGRHDEGLAEIKLSRELDPLNLIINASEGLYLLHAGKTDEALASLQKTLEINPNFWIAHLFASSAYIDKKSYPQAIAEARKAQEFSGASLWASAYLGYALAKSGKQVEARAVLEELLKLSTGRYVPAYYVALIYNGLGERDKTLEWLERGFEQRDAHIAFLKVEPKWNNLRDNPRFEDLLRKVGFPP